jgi:hypothetical protein
MTDMAIKQRIRTLTTHRATDRQVAAATDRTLRVIHMTRQAYRELLDEITTSDLTVLFGADPTT